MHIYNRYGKKQFTMQHIAGHQHWSSLTLFTYQKKKIRLPTFSDDTKSLLQVSRQTNAKWHVLILTLSKANFLWKDCRFFHQNISEFTDKVHGKKPNPQFYYVMFLPNYFVRFFLFCFFKGRALNHSCKIWEASFSVPRLIHPILDYIFVQISYDKSLSYNGHVSQLTTIWHASGKYKAKHHREITCLFRQNCAKLGVRQALLAITVLPLTGIFLHALIENMVISLPKGERN